MPAPLASVVASRLTTSGSGASSGDTAGDDAPALARLLALARTLHEAPDLEALGTRLLVGVAELVPAARGAALFRPGDDGTPPTAIAATGAYAPLAPTPRADAADHDAPALPIGHGLLATRTLHEGRTTVAVPDAAASVELVAPAIAVPLLAGDRAALALEVALPGDPPLAPRLVGHLETLAVHGGLAYERIRRLDEADRVARRNAALVRDLEHRAARLAAIARVQETIPHLDRGGMYATLARTVASVMDVAAVALLVHDAACDGFVPLHAEVDGAPLPAATLPVRIPSSALPAVARALREARPVRDVATWRWTETRGAGAPDDAATAAGGAGAGVELAVPALYGERVLAVLQLQSAEATAFRPADVELATMLARQAGAALELASRLEAQQRERDWAVAGSEIARAALADDSAADAALDMLRVLERLAPVDGAAIALTSTAPAERPHAPPASDRPDPASPESSCTVEWLAATGGAALLAGRTVPLDRSIASALPPDALASLTTAGAGAVELSLVTPGLAVVATRIVAHERMVGVLLVTLAPDDDGGAAREALTRLTPPIALALDAMARDREATSHRAHERSLATALSTLGDPVFLLDAEGCVHEANDAAMKTYGYARAELVGVPLDRLVVETPAPAWTLPATTVAAHLLPVDASGDGRTEGGVRRATQEHRRRDGTTFPVAVTRAPVMDDGGRAVGEVVLVRDLTGERRLEAHLRQQDKLAALGELIAGVAHELNNPITGISALAQLLLEDPLTEEQLESIRLVKREADRAAGIINDLLLFARRTSSHFTALDLNELVRATVRLRAYHLRSDGVQLELELAEPLPFIHADEQKLQQVLLHLLGNAEDAVEDAPVRVIRVRTRAEPDRVILEVADTGRGMSATAREHAFEPFFTTKRAGAGTGLGLSVSYGIVEAHGGLITVDSTPGRGTTFRVLLPRPLDSSSGVTDS